MCLFNCDESLVAILIARLWFHYVEQATAINALAHSREKDCNYCSDSNGSAPNFLVFKIAAEFKNILTNLIQTCSVKCAYGKM